MKGIFQLILLFMVGYAIGQFFGFWGVFCYVMFLVGYNFATWDDQMRRWKEKNGR